MTVSEESSRPAPTSDKCGPKTIAHHTAPTINAAAAEAGVTDLRLGIMAPDDSHHRATRDQLAEWVS